MMNAIKLLKANIIWSRTCGKIKIIESLKRLLILVLALSLLDLYSSENY